MLFDELLESEELDNLVDSLGDLVLGNPDVARAELELHANRSGEQLVVRVLEHVPDVGGHLLNAVFRGVDAVDNDRSCGGLEQPVEELGERRLARAVLPDDSDDLTVGDLEVNATEGDNVARRIDVARPADIDRQGSVGGG